MAIDIDDTLIPFRGSLSPVVIEAVRRTLGKPMRVMSFDLKGETHYDWRYRDGPNESDSKVFTAVFDRDLKVIRTMSVRDPDLDKGNQ